MTIQISKPFTAYVVETELPRTGDARKFEILFPYQVEGSTRTENFSRVWRYSGTQEAIDQKANVDGYVGRRARELQDFQYHIERELRTLGERLYSVDGQSLPIRGKL